MYKYLSLFLLVVCVSYRIPAGNDVDKQVMAAGESQLEVYLSKIEQGHEADYGFTNADHTEGCTIGKPYRLLAFNSDFYNKPISEGEDYFVIKNEWRVPVMLNGQSRVLLTVGGNSGNYSVTGMSDPLLARELQLKGTSMSNDDTWYLLQIPALAADFFVSEHDNSFIDAQFMPLASAVAALPQGKSAKPIYTLTEVGQMVKDACIKKDKHAEQGKKKAVKKHK